MLSTVPCLHWRYLSVHCLDTLWLWLNTVCSSSDNIPPSPDNLLPSVLWRCWLGGRKGIRPVKNLSGRVLAWLSVWSEMQTCMWPSWWHCHSLSLASVKSRLVLPFWYRLTRVVLEKGPLIGCVCVYLQTTTTAQMSEERGGDGYHTWSRPSSVLGMVTHFEACSPCVVTANINPSNSSRFSFSFLTKLSIAFFGNGSFSSPWKKSSA